MFFHFYLKKSYVERFGLYKHTILFKALNITRFYVFWDLGCGKQARSLSLFPVGEKVFYDLLPLH